MRRWITTQRVTSSCGVITRRRSEEHTSELQSRGHRVCRLRRPRHATSPAAVPPRRSSDLTMEGYFANFIKTGNPNGDGLPHWPAAAPKDGGLLRQVIGVDTHATVDHNAARYEFLRRHYTQEIGRAHV